MTIETGHERAASKSGGPLYATLSAVVVGVGVFLSLRVGTPVVLLGALLVIGTVVLIAAMFSDGRRAALWSAIGVLPGLALALGFIALIVVNVGSTPE